MEQLPSYRGQYNSINSIYICLSGQTRSISPEGEDKKHQQHAEGGHIIHCLHQDHQLSPQSRQEAHQLEHTQEPKGPEHGKTSISLSNNLPYTSKDTHTPSQQDQHQLHKCRMMMMTHTEFIQYGPNNRIMPQAFSLFTQSLMFNLFT